QLFAARDAGGGLGGAAALDQGGGHPGLGGGCGGFHPLQPGDLIDQPGLISLQQIEHTCESKPTPRQSRHAPPSSSASSGLSRLIPCRRCAPTSSSAQSAQVCRG